MVDARSFFVALQCASPWCGAFLFRRAAQHRRPSCVERGSARATPSVHRLKLFVDPQLADGIGAAEAGRRLAQYVADVNTVFTRETVRSFVFDPVNDLQLIAPADAPPCSHSGLVNGEIAVCISKSARGYSHGGLAASWTFPQKGVAWNLNWIAIHDPLRLSRDITKAAPESPKKTTWAASSRHCCTSWSTCSAPARASTTTPRW